MTHEILPEHHKSTADIDWCSTGKSIRESWTRDRTDKDITASQHTFFEHLRSCEKCNAVFNFLRTLPSHSVGAQY